MSRSPDLCDGCPSRSDEAAIPQGDQLSHTLIISDYYILTTGRYTVFVTALVHNQSYPDGVWIKANSIKLEVQ